MKARTFRDEQREAEQRSHMAYLASPAAIKPGKGVKMPDGATYRRSSDGHSLIRTNKPRGTKKERRRARAAAKLAAAKPIEQVQAELAAEGGA